MALIRADFVKETSTVTGTGAITLAGLRSPGQPFSAVCANGDTFRYAISNQSGPIEWEVGLGTYNSGPNTITRSPVASSNGGGLVSFTAGTKFVDLVVDTAQYNAFLTTAGAGGGVAVSALGQSVSAGTVTLSNFNNVSFGMSGSVVTATVPTALELLELRTMPAALSRDSLTNATETVHTGSRLVFARPSPGYGSVVSLNNVVFFQSGDSVLGGAYMAVLAGIGGGAGQHLSFSNANAVSWGGGTTTVAGDFAGVHVQVSAIVPRVRAVQLYNAATNSISGATESTISGSSAVTLNLPALSNDAGTNSSISYNNVFFRMSGSNSVQGAALQRYFGTGIVGGVAAQQVSFANGNNVTIGITSSTFAGFGVVPIYTVSVAPFLGLVSHVGGNVVSSVSALVFSNASNVTWSLSTAAGAATVLASVAAGGGGGITALALSNAVSAVSATGITFSNANGFSFLLSTGAGAATISGSYTVPVVPAFAVSAAGASASSGTVVWSNANNVSFGQAGSTITASATVAATREIGVVSHIGGNVVSSVSQLAFSNASNVTFSLSTAAGAATVIASVAAGGGGGITYSGFIPFRGEESVVASLANASFMVCPLGDVPAFQFDRVVWAGSFSNNSASTNSNTLRFMVGLYTKNASTLSLVQSSSTSLAFTGSGTVGNYSLFSGFRLLTMGWTSTLGASNYWVACGLSNSTAGNAAVSFSIAMLTQNFSVAPNLFNVANNASAQRILGQGVFTSTSSVAPASMAFSHIIGSNSTGWRAPAVHFASQSA